MDPRDGEPRLNFKGDSISLPTLHNVTTSRFERPRGTPTVGDVWVPKLLYCLTTLFISSFLGLKIYCKWVTKF